MWGTTFCSRLCYDAGQSAATASRQAVVSWLTQVPTWRADPLHPECDTWCEFPVADRPNAVQQWINSAKKDPTLIKVGMLWSRVLSSASLPRAGSIVKGTVQLIEAVKPELLSGFGYHRRHGCS